MSDHQRNNAIGDQQASVACYLNEIPSFVETELEQLYGHLFSSLPFFETFRTTENVCTYVARQNGQPTAILLFTHKGRKVEVLNEMIHIDETEIRRFVDYVFANFPSVAIIGFKAIQTDTQHLPYPYQRHNSKEDFVISPLPNTPDEYTSMIGPSTRSNLKYYSKKIKKDYPTFNHEFYVKEEIDERHVREIIRLSEQRIFAKKKRFGIDEEETRRIVHLAKICGLVNVVTIDGRLCAGTVAYCTGSSYLVMVNAHDSKYDGYRLGGLCYYLTICESIARGGKRFHMGGGRYKYKSRLLGVRQDMDHVEIYRSYGRALLNSDQAVKTVLQSCVRKLKLWLLEREQSRVSQFVFSTLLVLRRITRYTAGDGRKT